MHTPGNCVNKRFGKFGFTCTNVASQNDKRWATGQLLSRPNDNFMVMLAPSSHKPMIEQYQCLTDQPLFNLLHSNKCSVALLRIWIGKVQYLTKQIGAYNGLNSFRITATPPDMYWRELSQ